MRGGGRAVALAILALAVGGGCTTPTEGDRRVNHQQKEIGGYVEKTSTQPEIQQAGRDVKANAETLEKNLIGPAEKPQPYSPQASREAREQSEQDHATPWWQLALGGLATFLTGNIFTRLFGTVAPRLIGGPVAGAALSVIGAIARVREEGQANGGQLRVEDLLAAIQKEASTNPAAAALIRELAHKAEAKLAAKL